jgi:hypothetical protein
MLPRPDAAQESYRVRPRSSEEARVCRAKVDLEACKLVRLFFLTCIAKSALLYLQTPKKTTGKENSNPTLQKYSST